RGRRFMSIFAQIGRPCFSGKAREVRPDVPTPHRGRAVRRRQLMFREAKELLPFLPRELGEATHALMSGRYDLMVLLVAILVAVGGTCHHLRVATLSFNARNVGEMAALLRSGKVKTLTLLCSAFFCDHNKDVFTATLREARTLPSWRVAAARNHCKVICADL